MSFHFNSSKTNGKVTDILKNFSFFRYNDIIFLIICQEKRRPKFSGGRLNYLGTVTSREKSIIYDEIEVLTDLSISS